ncbi:7827_t:CDS:2, partial [Racocetra fulgida]
ETVGLRYFVERDNEFHTELEQQQPTVDNLLHDIKSMIEGLQDLNVNPLQIVKDKLEHVLKQV